MGWGSGTGPCSGVVLRIGREGVMFSFVFQTSMLRSVFKREIHVFVQVAATMKRPATATRISNSISVLVVVMVDTVVLVIVSVTTYTELRPLEKMIISAVS